MQTSEVFKTSESRHVFIPPGGIFVFLQLIYGVCLCDVASS